MSSPRLVTPTLANQVAIGDREHLDDEILKSAKVQLAGGPAACITTAQQAPDNFRMECGHFVLCRDAIAW